MSINKDLPKQEKYKLLNGQSVNPEVLIYLMDKLENLYIEVLGDYKGYIFELIPNNKLEGWCWQTTESAIVFLNDDDYIERGELYLDENQDEYYHSWICFKYNYEEYVFDPCLNLLCKKDSFHKAFDVKLKGKVTAKEVKEELIRQVTTPKKKEPSKYDKFFEDFWKDLMGEEQYKKYQEEKKDEVVVSGIEDANTPLYRNGAGYKTEIENGKIKRLTVHYYING